MEKKIKRGPNVGQKNSQYWDSWMWCNQQFKIRRAYQYWTCALAGLHLPTRFETLTRGKRTHARPRLQTQAGRRRDFDKPITISDRTQKLDSVDSPPFVAAHPRDETQTFDSRKLHTIHSLCCISYTCKETESCCTLVGGQKLLYCVRAICEGRWIKKWDCYVNKTLSYLNIVEFSAIWHSDQSPWNKLKYVAGN